MSDKNAGTLNQVYKCTSILYTSVQYTCTLVSVKEDLFSSMEYHK